MKSIQSIKEPLIVQARGLATQKGRAAQNKFLLEGEQSIIWAIEAGVFIEHVFIHEKLNEQNIPRQLADKDIDCFTVSEGILKKINNRRYLVPLIAVAHAPAHSGAVNSLENDMIVVLDRVMDAGNIGTIFRTARGFGLKSVAVTQADFDAFTPKTIDASRGSVFQMDVHCYASDAEAIQSLKQKGYRVIATSPRAKQLQSALNPGPGPVALFVGNETEGVSDTVLGQADFLVQVPMHREMESLNVGVFTGISIYEIKLKLVIAMLLNYIKSTLGREVNVAGKLLQSILDKRLREVSQYNGMQVIFMMVLKCDEKMTLEQISRDTALFGEELDEFIHPLHENGLIEQAGPESWSLTAEGERLLGDLWGIVESVENDALTGFNADDKRRFMDYLSRLQENCIRILDEKDS